MDPNKAYEIGRQGDEQRFRSLIQDALSEGNEAVASWLINKVKAAHEGSFKDIIEEAVEYANTESEAYKPTDLAKKYWNEYFPEAEQQALATKELPKDDEHFGEGQAEGLDNLLEGLKDTPHDNRW